MASDAPNRSLSDLFRSLSVAPDCREALVQLAEQVEQNSARLACESEYEQMLAQAQASPPRRWPHRPGGRDRHGLHIVRGMGVPLLAAGAWAWRTGARRAAAAGIAMATVAAGSVAAPGMLQQAPAALPPAAVAHHHPRADDRHRAPGSTVVPGVLPTARRRRRAVLDDDDMRKTAARHPRPTAAPSPVPLPSVTPSPLPSPTPTCLDLTGNHCHHHNGTEVLRGLQNYHDLS